MFNLGEERIALESTSGADASTLETMSMTLKASGPGLQQDSQHAEDRLSKQKHKEPLLPSLKAL